MRQFDEMLRPRWLAEYVGQDRIREMLWVAITAARKRGEALDHVLLHGPSGVGKSTLVYVIGNELGVNVFAASRTAIENQGVLAGILTSLGDKDVLFIDEIHSMLPAPTRMMHQAVDDYEVGIVIGARTQMVPVKQFTLVAATTRTEFLLSPLRSRFGMVYRMESYRPSDIEEIVSRSARILSVRIDVDAVVAISEAAQSTPRNAISLLHRVRDFAEVQAEGTITGDVAHAALKLLVMDEDGTGETVGTPRECISDEVRIFVWQRDRGGCAKCGSQARLEFDHIIPLAKGGSNTARNIQLLCESCNRRKGVDI